MTRMEKFYGGTAGIYGHVPFCVKKCRYCDFVSCPADAGTKKRYVDALLTEIGRRSDKIVPFDTVFIGGGTPSVLEIEDLKRIGAALRNHFDITNDAEITVEANPESLTPEKAAAMREFGANRISIGFQSLAPRALGVLGRVHTKKRALEAYNNAVKAGFDNVNIDLMLGLPGEPEGEFECSLREVIALSPAHISVYSLILEEGTPLEKDISEGLAPEPDEDRDRADYHLAARLLREAGYDRYEISNFAKPGKRSRHNLRYWEQKMYFGFGPAAASYIGDRRFTNTCDIGLYVDKGGDAELSEYDTLSLDETMREFMMLGFRLAEGPDFREFERRFGTSPTALYGDRLDELERKGLIGRKNDAARPYALTEKGLDFANIVFREFV